MLPHIQWASLITVVSATGLLLTLNHCEQNPIITALPGNQWEFSDTFFTVVDTILVRTPVHGDSYTLYAGQTNDQDESGILIKFDFASVDTSWFSGLQAAKLYLFRRTFASEPSEIGTDFNLYVIDESDTVWAESDTGLTLDNFPNLTFQADSAMVVDTATVTVIVDEASSDSVLEHLAFQVDTLLLRQWAAGNIVNNGFLIRQESQGTLIGFHSGNSFDLSPYLALTFADTTSTGADTTITQYYLPSEDLSIYPSHPDNSVYSDGLLHLDHSSGIRSHIDFGPDFEVDTTSIIAGARLILYVNRSEYPIIANQVDFQVRRRVWSLVEGDSTVVLIDKFTCSKESDSLTLNLGSYIAGLAIGSISNYGLDLVVIPNNHDFDHFVFWGSSAPDSLKIPRLEVTYSRLYEGFP